MFAIATRNWLNTLYRFLFMNINSCKYESSLLSSHSFDYQFVSTPVTFCGLWFRLQSSIFVVKLTHLRKQPSKDDQSFSMWDGSSLLEWITCILSRDTLSIKCFINNCSFHRNINIIRRAVFMSCSLAEVGRILSPKPFPFNRNVYIIIVWCAYTVRSIMRR